MSAKRKISAIVIACVVVAAAVGVPIAIGTPTGATVEKVSPVVNSITFYEWSGSDWVEIGAEGLTLAPYTDATTVAETSIKIVADVTCGNGQGNVGTVTASFDDLAAGDYSGSLTLTRTTGSNYATPDDTGDTLKLKSWVTSGGHDVNVTAIHKHDGSLEGVRTATLNVAATKAITVSSQTLTFLNIESGTELTPGVASAEATVAVTSLGNDAIAGLTVTPDELTGGIDGIGTIAGSAITDPSAVDSKWDDISIAACTSSGTSEKDISFVLTVPEGTPAGDYTGTITIAVPTA